MHIGIIDSGEGGRSFYHKIKEKFPFFSYSVLIDKAFFPYGEKEESFLFNRGTKLIKRLNKCDFVIIACNTLSIALDEISDFNVIKITELTVKEAQKYKRIGLMGSKYTIMSKYYQKRLKIVWEYNASQEIKDIEKGFIPVFPALPDMDLLILGCTHFIKIKKAFEGLNVLSQDDLNFHNYWEN